MTDKALAATINFMRDRESGGVWSNEQADLVDQPLLARSVAIADGRAGHAARLDAEGFALVDHPLAQARWDERAWIDGPYVESCTALVARLTGAAEVVSYYPPLVRMADPAERERSGAAPPGTFVHLDNTRQSSARSLVRYLGEDLPRRYARWTIYNVWRVLTPPPQNTPLAICDRRTLDPGDLVEGATNLAGQLYPYWGAVYGEGQRWSYFPDMVPEEAIVFVSMDPFGESPGCLHTGFDVPRPEPAAAARVSVEARVVAFFDS